MPTLPIEASGRIGPNATIQTGHALNDVAGAEAARAVFRQAGLDAYLGDPPQDMVRQEEAAALFDALRRHFPAKEADALLAEAGRRTAGYIIAHRIPPPVARLLGWLPAGLGARLLLISIARHAWTFAGSGAARIRLGFPMMLEIAANPVATPDCHWHAAILRELFCRLVAPGFAVRHTECCAKGDPVCRFVIAAAARPARHAALGDSVPSRS